MNATVRRTLVGAAIALTALTGCSAAVVGTAQPDDTNIESCVAAVGDQTELDQIASDIKTNGLNQQAARSNGADYAATVDRLVRERAALDQQVLSAQSHLRTDAAACVTAGA